MREWQRAEHWKSETGIEKRRTLNRECGGKESEKKQENWGMGEEKRGTLRTGEQSVWKKRVRENRECGDEMSESEPVVRDNRRDASAASNATFARAQRRECVVDVQPNRRPKFT